MTMHLGDGRTTTIARPASWAHRRLGAWPGACGSARRIRRAAVKPERPSLYSADPEQPGRSPGITGETRPDLVLICRLDHVQGLFAVADRAAEDDEPIIDQSVHKCCVLIPAVLVPYPARGVPARPVNEPDREISHTGSVMAATDIQRRLDEVGVDVEFDPEPRVVAEPADLARALDADPLAVPPSIACLTG